MAEKRMFSKQIIDSDNFLSLSLSAQALYFHLAMRADDDGFIDNPKKIIRMVGADDCALQALIDRQFVISFESEIIVIRHWKMHNSIKQDRYKATIYQAEKEMITEQNKVYVLCKKDKNAACNQSGSELEPSRSQVGTKMEPGRNQNGAELEPQSRLDKNSIDKISIGSRVVNNIINNIGQECECEVNGPAALPEKSVESMVSVPAPELNKATTAPTEAKAKCTVSGPFDVGSKSEVSGPATAAPSRKKEKSKVSVPADAVSGLSLELDAYVSPTLDALRKHVELKKLEVDCEKFYEYYSARGWRTKNGKRIDWKLKLRDWHRSEIRSGEVKSKNPFLELMKEGAHCDG